MATVIPFPVRVPQRFAEADIGSLSLRQMKEVIDYSKSIEEQLKKGIGLFLSGPPGVGKTWAMAALTRFYASRGQGLRRSPDYEFVTAPDMFENLGDFGERVDEYRQRSWLDTYSKIPWLVINDLGKEYRGGKLAESVPYQLGRVLRARSERRVVTHVTTNMSGEDISNVYGGSITSLLEEMSIFVRVTGKDRRSERSIKVR